MERKRQLWARNTALELDGTPMFDDLDMREVTDPLTAEVMEEIVARACGEYLPELSLVSTGATVDIEKINTTLEIKHADLPLIGDTCNHLSNAYRLTQAHSAGEFATTRHGSVSSSSRMGVGRG